MHVSRPLAAVLGLVTLWPPVYFVAFIGFMFTTVFWPEPQGFDRVFEAVFVAHLLTMLIIMGLLAFYVVHLFKNETLRDDRRVLWAVVLFMGNVFAFPVYWYLHVWQAPPRGAR